MKKIAIFAILVGLLTTTAAVHAQGMMGQNFFNTQQSVDSTTTAQDEAEGKAVWDKLQSKQVDCKNLTDDDYDVLGDYFMGLMAGGNHAAMNESMVRMMGDEGEKQMHIVMGKRFSGCDAAAVLPAQYQGFSNMMPMMGGFNYQNYPWHNSLMGKYGFSVIPAVCWMSLILVWTVLVFVILALAHYIKGPKRK
jgi:hypothetical protein